MKRGLAEPIVRQILNELRLDIRPHHENDAYAAAKLYEQTENYGSGIGDRSCMALGIALGLPVLTADRQWRKVTVENLVIEYLR